MKWKTCNRKSLSGFEILEFKNTNPSFYVNTTWSKEKKHFQEKNIGVGYIYKWTMFSKDYTDN